MDVAYSRVMFLGTAGVGKTCLRKSLMKEQWDPSSHNSTIISDVHSVRPVEYQWQSLGHDADDEWREVTEEDEIQEMAELLAAVHNHHGSGRFKSKMSAMQLFKDDQSFSDHAEVSKMKVEEFERTHVQLIFSKAMNRARSITSPQITPQPFVHLWDCGGQPVFLEILPAFLTSRTMFLLIYDASKSFHDQWKSFQTIRGESKEEEEVNMTTLDFIHSWLSNIHIHLAKYDSDGGLLDYPRVLSIGTHGDKVGEDKAKIKELESHIKGKPSEALIDGFYIVNNTTAGKNEDAEFSEIRKKIFDFTLNKLIVKTPISWVLFRKVIEVYKANVISLEEAQAIGVACKIPAEVVPKVLLFYHDLGVVLFYPHIRGLHDKVIIVPKWFVGVLAKVLTLEGREEYKTRLMWDLLREKGILVQPLYVAAWREVQDISPEALIELLVHFRLAAKVTTDEYHDPDVKQYFLPLVLPSYDDQEQHLSGYHQRATPLHLTFRTKFVPPGFFTRLVTILAESSKCSIRFNKGVYRNKVHIYYGDHLRDDVILMALPHAIQVEVFRYCPDNEFLPKFTDVCQMLRKDLIKMSTEVDRFLFDSRNKCKVFKEVRFLCTNPVCPEDVPHYLLQNNKQTSGLDLNCDRNDKYRQLTTEESVWFPSNKKKEITPNLEDRELLQISQKIPDQDSLFRLAAVLNMISELRCIQADDSKRNLAGFNLLFDWQNAKNGYRSQLVKALKESKLCKLAQMVQQCEYNPEKLIVEFNDVNDTSPPTIQQVEVPQTPFVDGTAPLIIQPVEVSQIPLVVGTSPSTIQPVEISDNDLLRCACYINEGDISKLIRALNDPTLNLQSVIQDDDDAQMKAYHILKKWLQAHPDTTKNIFREKLKLLGFRKAAKK